MGVRDLPAWADDWVEPERPYFTQAAIGDSGGGQVTARFSDELSRRWYAEWLQSKAGWAAYLAWLDQRR